MQEQFAPTRRIAHRVAGLHDNIGKALLDLGEITDRKVPVTPERMACAVRLLDSARRTLSRHQLATEVPPLAAAPPAMPGDLFVRYARASRALQALFEELCEAIDMVR